VTGPGARGGMRIHGPDPVRLRWPGPQDELARVLPVLVRVGDAELVVAPGVPVVIPLRRFAVAAVPPGAQPLVAELERGSAEVLELPFPVEAVAVPPPAASPHGTVAFGFGAWTAEPAGAAEFAVARHGDGLSVAPGRSGISKPARLMVAARTTPTRVVAVPALAPGETALVDLTVARPFGHRPALLASDPATRLLLAYLAAGEFRIARQMARRLVAVRAAERPVAWSEPSLAQLVVGYALAAGDDGPRLAAWCRRARADRLLGVDGLVLAATAAWRRGRPEEAARLLDRAGRTGPPVMSLGLEWAVRLAFQLQARGHRTEELDRLVTGYSVVAASSDPLADTVTAPESPRRPLSLEGRGLVARARWALPYLAVRIRLPHTVRATDHAARIVGVRPIAQSRPGAGMNQPDTAPSEATSLGRYRFPLIVVLLIFIGAVAIALIDAAWNVPAVLAAPLSLLAAALFTLLGMTITLAAGQDRDEQDRELRRRAEAGERRATAAEEEAMKGRALAAALQADARTEPSRDSVRHARLSRGLFGDLLGDEPDTTENQPGRGEQNPGAVGRSR
jgi:hypothetical protein